MDMFEKYSKCRSSVIAAALEHSHRWGMPEDVTDAIVNVACDRLYNIPVRIACAYLFGAVTGLGFSIAVAWWG